MDLSVYRNDNPSVVAKQFLEENNLPIHLVPAIAQKIAHSVLEASRKRVGDHAISPPPQSPVTSSPSIEPSSPEVYNEMRSIEVTSPEETQFNEIRRSSFSPKYSDEIKGIKRVDSRAMSTGSLRRANSANSLSRPNSRLEQLYLSADKYRDHREELRRKMEEERQAAIIESDFRSESP